VGEELEGFGGWPGGCNYQWWLEEVVEVGGVVGDARDLELHRIFLFVSFFGYLDVLLWHLYASIFRFFLFQYAPAVII